MDSTKAFSVDNGIIIDEDNGGPFFTGGTASPIGLGMPVETIYTQTTASGILVWQKYGAGDTASDWRLYPSSAISFDPTPTDSLTATNLQSAIEELEETAAGTSKAFTLAQYGGNANVGRYLLFYAGIASDDAPLESTAPLRGLEIIARTTGVSATCTLGFYDIEPVTPVLLYTVTFTADKEVVLSGTSASPLFTLPALGQLAIKVDSGSITKPHLSIVTQGG